MIKRVSSILKLFTILASSGVVYRWPSILGLGAITLPLPVKLVTLILDPAAQVSLKVTHV